MEVGSVASAAAVVNDALGQVQQARAAKFEMAVLKKTLQSSEQVSQELLQMLGDVGQNLNVVA